MGTAAGTRGSRRGLRHLNGLPSPASVGQWPAGGSLSTLPPTRPLTPGGGTPWTSKGIKAGEGQATRAQLFFPSRPSSPLFCFWLLASLGSKMLAGGNLQEKACSARDTSRKTMWSAEAGNGLEARVGVGKTGRRGAEGSSRLAQTREESNSKCYPQYFLSPKPRDPRYRTQSQAGSGRSLGGW